MQIRILEELREIKALIRNKVNDRWMNLRELSEFTSLSTSTIRRAVKRRVLKASRKTGKLLFNIEDVKRWLNG
ncbi:helix-turn-helix domain-containing protein [Candidatus Neomarinimicrobiota bacterium]